MNTEKWTDDLDKLSVEFKNEFGSLNDKELNFKPDANTWSILQNADHLINTNKSYFPVISGLRDGKNSLPFFAGINFIVNFFGKTILNSVSPDRKRKMKTFAVWEPSSSDLRPDTLEKFYMSNSQLKDLIKSCTVLLDKGAVISSPANKNIVYRLETAFDIIITHQRRHLEQAKEVRKVYLKVNKV